MVKGFNKLPPGVLESRQDPPVMKKIMDGISPEQPSPLAMGAPQGAPMSMPNPKEGMQAKARSDISEILNALKKTLDPNVFEVHGPEWKAIDSAVRGLGKIVGDQQSKEVGQAGIKLLASSQGPKGLAGIMGGQGGMPMGGPAPNILGGMG